MIMKTNGVNSEEILKDEDIEENQQTTGYHKKILIKDYVLITSNKNKKTNLVKEITVEISYKVANKEKKLKLSTYVSQYN